MESLNFCPNCNEKFTEVFLFPCMHNFCSNCTNLMKNETRITCLICSNSCYQDEVKKNAFLEKICLSESQNKTSKIELIVCELCETDSTENQADKYCVDCSQYICLKCSARHVKTEVCKYHNIVDKDNLHNLVIKSQEPYCEKHGIKYNIYCKLCNKIMCGTCCSLDMYHLHHDISDKLEEVFSESNSDLKNKIVEIDDMIEDQNKLIKENKVLQNILFKKCNNVREGIEMYAKELKDEIDNLTNANVDRIISIRNNFFKSFQAKLKEISDYISSLTNLKSYLQEVLNKGSNVDVLNTKKELNKKTLIDTKKPKLIPKYHLSFQKPSLNTFILTELSESLNFFEIKDSKIMLINSIISACVFKQKIYTTKSNDKSIDIYNIETNKYQTSIYYKQYFTKDKDSCVHILSTKNNLFLYYINNSSKDTCILKFKDDDKTFFELKTLEYDCTIMSTFQQTLLIRTTTNLLIELSENGDELKRVTVLEEAINLSLYHLYYYITAHKLNDGRYVVNLLKGFLNLISLLDAQGILIKSFTQADNYYYSKACAVSEKFVFVLYKHLYMNIIMIRVLSTDLQELHQFDCPGVVNIFYDRVYDKLLLVKDREIIYISYRPGMRVSI